MQSYLISPLNTVFYWLLFFSHVASMQGTQCSTMVWPIIKKDIPVLSFHEYNQTYAIQQSDFSRIGSDLKQSYPLHRFSTVIR